MTQNSISTMSVARAIATKDLRIEWRSKVLVNQVLPFAGIVMVLFAFALDNDGILQRVAPGLVWLAVLFSSLIIVQRTFAIESADNALDAIKVAGVSSAGVFLGKSVALAVQLLLFECVLVMLSLVLYQVQLSWGGAVLLVTVSVLANVGIATMGALYGGLGAAAKGRETLLPLLLLPAVAPVLIAATRATESAFGVSGAILGEGWPWVALLAVFGALFGFGGTLAFGVLTEE
jgi:heme exporter protein B